MQYGYAYQLGERAGGLDPDAKAYILAVEAADGQTLEDGVKKAYNTFVKGCKSDSIWDAIKASCIMAGARTLSGALVPLKGTAPTNFNFVSGDYDRKTGIVGNGTTKYLNSNRNNNSDPQNSKHISVYRSVAATDTSGTGGLIGNFTSANGASWIFDHFSANNDAVRINQSPSIVSLDFGTSAGLISSSRLSSTSIRIRWAGVTTSYTTSSQTPANQNIDVFRGVAQYSKARLSFYSIGENLTLNLLDNRVSKLISDIAVAIP